MLIFGKTCLSLWRNTSITFLFPHFLEENLPIIDKASYSDKHLNSKVIKQIKITRVSLLIDEAFLFQYDVSLLSIFALVVKSTWI